MFHLPYTTLFLNIHAFAKHRKAPDKDQWERMSPQLQSLPDELLVQVLGYLPRFDLKSARLTCSRTARTGAQWLFQRVYFAPRSSAIETFINISSNPVFARNVTELVYDARLFLSEFARYESYKEAFDAFTVELPEDTRTKEQAYEAYYRQVAIVNWKSPGAEDYGQSLVDTMSRYLLLLDQQQRIFEDKEDYEVLCAGLKHLPNITTVIVLDQFVEWRDWVPLRTDEHSWYHERSQREIAVPVQPVSWARDKTQDPDKSNKWDVRGFQHLIRAVSQHGHNVVELHVASESSSAPLSIFGMDQDVCDDICSMVRRLNLLKVHLYMSPSCSDVEWSEQEDRLNVILSEAKNLRCLAIGGRIEINLLMNKVWPHLETLILGDITMQADELKAIVQAHKDSLREASFRNIYLCGDEGWVDVAEEVGKDLRLCKIDILGVADDVTWEVNGEDPYLEGEATEAVACSFMPSVPRTQCWTRTPSAATMSI